jgi:hypothetical protein
MKLHSFVKRSSMPVDRLLRLHRISKSLIRFTTVLILVLLVQHLFLDAPLSLIAIAVADAIITIGRIMVAAVTD